MKNYLLHTVRVFMSIAKSLTIFVVSIVMLLSLVPVPVLAISHTEVQKPLEASQVTDGIPDQLDSPAKEERREWQSQASSIREDEDNVPSTLSEKLNLDELAKGYDPEREAEKRSVPTP